MTIDKEQPAMSPKNTDPTLDLPEYHGRAAVAMKSKVNGAGNRLGSVHEIGDRVVGVVELKMKGAGHIDADGKLVYVEEFAVVDLIEVSGKAGLRLLTSARAHAALDSPERPLDDGINSLAPPPIGDALATDESGVVMTPAEAAAMDPASVLGDNATDPVVVIFSDGVRLLWPDEFDKGESKPVLGEEVEGDGDEGLVYVVELLDGVTGESLGQWTDADQDARLLAREQAAEAAEALAEARDLSEVDPAGANDDGPGPDEEPFPVPGVVDSHGAPDDELEADDVDGDTEEAPATLDDLDEDSRNAYYLSVDMKVNEFDVTGISNKATLIRMRLAEEAGRGRGLQPRAGILEKIDKRLAELFSDLASIPPVPPPPAGEFGPTDGEE